VVRIAKAPPEQTWVVFEEVPRENWAMGGVLGSEPK
jgi:phenylpyruvate tautomerase PptA (4-oxalocrotonate tautomerase family)